MTTISLTAWINQESTVDIYSNKFSSYHEGVWSMLQFELKALLQNIVR